jgi:LPS O-antigen subunit length determinant protein (WzzB/FepE family)
MKKKFSDLIEGEVNFADLLIKCWKEKILILSITIICVMLSYLYVFALQQEFKTEITIKNPPEEIFFSYERRLYFYNPTTTNNNNNNNNNNNVTKQFILDFNLKLLSLDNLERFVEQSNEFDDFKEYLKIKKMTPKKYFQNNKFGQFKEKNQTIVNKYFLIFPKELDGITFINNYVEFTKNRQIIEHENKLKLLIKDDIEVFQQALVSAKLVNLENPVLIAIDPRNTIANSPEFLFYRGSKILTQQITNFEKMLSNLENNKLNYNPILDKASVLSVVSKFSFLYIVAGLIFGFFLSFVIIFFKALNKN